MSLNKKRDKIRTITKSSHQTKQKKKKMNVTEAKNKKTKEIYYPIQFSF